MTTSSLHTSSGGPELNDAGVSSRATSPHINIGSPPLKRSTTKSSSPQRNCLLVIIGVLLICTTILSLSIGHYHHLHYDISSVQHLSLQDFLGEGTKVKTADKNKQTADEEIIKTTNTNIIPMGKKQQTIDERTAFESIIQRVKWTKEQCNNVPPEQRNTVQKELKVATDLPMLPEGGVASALEQWLKDNPPPSSSSAARNNNNDAYPTCYIPPPKSCHISTYTLIIMSHTTERLQAFMDPLRSMIDSWPGLTEIIIVWNSPRETLTSAATDTENNNGKEKRYAIELLKWDEDTSHPLRIFFALENGLTNNLLNRYHPKLQPKNEAVMYFDDDGPFWSRESMVYGGLELWKRNSNVQVGGFPRNVRFLSNRMKDIQNVNLQSSIDLIQRDVNGYENENHATFTPTCRNVTGDHVEYNYFSFPDFAGHVLLPSGTFLHRNYLCFIWHPAFEELRQWVIAHKTMPDDMTVSTLISHLSGRSPRTFPREIAETGGRRRLLETVKRRRVTKARGNESIADADHGSDHNILLQSPPPDQSHRRLLWKQKGWGNMREEAINSILGYFGSIHPGTVGWCAGTEYMRNNNRGVPFVCHPEKPTLDLIPWLTQGGIGSTQCPLDPTLLEQSAKLLAKHKKEKEESKLAFEDFCGECKYKNSFSCQERLDYLINKYDNVPKEAKDAVIKEDSNCEKKKR